MRQRSSYNGKFAVVDSILGPETRSEPLDEHEQEAVIREFEALSQQQHMKWRLVIGSGTLAAGIFFLYAAWRQYVDPFGVRYTGELRTAISGDAATTVLIVQALSLLISAAGLLNSHLPPPGGLPYITYVAHISTRGRLSALRSTARRRAVVGCRGYIAGGSLLDDGAGAHGAIAWAPARRPFGVILAASRASGSVSVVLLRGVYADRHGAGDTTAERLSIPLQEAVTRNRGS
ncbi:hypothetical protein VaNZ11_015485 [Volvox africanus]|uniref:Uncharacterized protein n=1 Tax=Volvox africanus TaxID=51714 RepID=A0ABQ5SKP9_9CHLO|nr:hypothetical protein VaNZ11_015485 [Volvox africanus]